MPGHHKSQVLPPVTFRKPVCGFCKPFLAFSLEYQVNALVLQGRANGMDLPLPHKPVHYFLLPRPVPLFKCCNQEHFPGPEAMPFPEILQELLIIQVIITVKNIQISVGITVLFLISGLFLDFPVYLL